MNFDWPALARPVILQAAFAYCWGWDWDCCWIAYFRLLDFVPLFLMSPPQNCPIEQFSEEVCP
jgi:hypothetical protein